MSMVPLLSLSCSAKIFCEKRAKSLSDTLLIINKATSIIWKSCFNQICGISTTLTDKMSFCLSQKLLIFIVKICKGRDSVISLDWGKKTKSALQHATISRVQISISRRKVRNVGSAIHFVAELLA